MNLTTDQLNYLQFILNEKISSLYHSLKYAGPFCDLLKISDQKDKCRELLILIQHELRNTP